MRKIRAKVRNLREWWEKATKSQKNYFTGPTIQAIRITMRNFPILCNKYAVLHKKVCFLCNRMHKM